ncbi:MAG: HEAT repeat domain-containing protein [Planctomycetaceae bacterium]
MSVASRLWSRIGVILLLTILFGGKSWLHPCHAADNAVIKQSVSKARDYLHSTFGKYQSNRKLLAAYALLKAGDPPTSPEIAGVLADIEKTYSVGSEQLVFRGEMVYEAGVAAMLLVEVDAEKYQPLIENIANALLNDRRENGSWDYRRGDGDTSVTQYGCLGLWAAARAGVEIPDEAWDKILQWHFATQLSDGGFAYTPGKAIGPGQGAPTLNMTGAAIGSMSIAAMYLFPEQMGQAKRAAASQKKAESAEETRKFGVLDRSLPESEEEQGAGDENLPITRRPQGPYKVRSSFSEYKQHVAAAVNWMNGHFEVVNSTGPKMYYYYTLERMTALTEIDQLAGQDWFDVCSEAVIGRQLSDGSWNLAVHDGGGVFPVGTSFGILFLTRSTAKLLNRMPGRSAIGGGLLAGGRGLPDDLKQVDLEHGDVKAREPSGPLDELLRDLSKAGGDDLFEVQEKIVEKIQLGDRSELVGQTEQLVKLLEHPQPEIRRTAMWALGRSDDLSLVRYAIEAILDDPDTDVLIEAHAALCWFSRRPDGFGLPDNPIASLSPDVSDEDRKAAVDKWRRLAVKAWGEWYLRVCPYEERDDPFVISLKRRLSARG